MKTKVRKWFRGLFGGAIAGGAGAVSASIGLAAAHAAGAPVQPLDLKQIGAVFISGVVVSTVTYLKQSPLPPENGNGDTEHVTKP